MQIKKECTLLELVQTVSKAALTDDEVVTIVAYLVNSGRVRLCGTFAGAKISRHASLSTFLKKRQSPSPSLSDSLLAA
jgi:hypothetical protein